MRPGRLCKTRPGRAQPTLSDRLGRMASARLGGAARPAPSIRVRLVRGRRPGPGRARDFLVTCFRRPATTGCRLSESPALDVPGPGLGPGPQVPRGSLLTGERDRLSGLWRGARARFGVMRLRQEWRCAALTAPATRGAIRAALLRACRRLRMSREWERRAARIGCEGRAEEKHKHSSFRPGLSTWLGMRRGRHPSACACACVCVYLAYRMISAVGELEPCDPTYPVLLGTSQAPASAAAGASATRGSRAPLPAASR